jgi:hypothetical protein
MANEGWRSKIYGLLTTKLNKMQKTGEQIWIESLIECYTKPLQEQITKLQTELEELKKVNSISSNPVLAEGLPCHHNYIQKDTYWKSCTHCGMIAPLGQ